MNIPIADFIMVLLIFMRIFFAFVAAPIFGDQSIPVLAKIFLSMIISYIVFITINKSGIQVEFGLAWIAANAFKEILTGLIIGFMMNFIFYAISFAGSLMGFSIGLSIAESLNPINGSSENVFGQLFFYAAVLLLFLINGHHYIISGLVYSFSIVHLGKFTITGPVYELLIQYTAEIFVIAVKIASPIIVSFFLVYLAEGILARVVPQMQVFFVGQPLLVGLGFFMLISLTPIYIYVIKSLLRGYEYNLVNVIKAMGQ